MREKRREDGPTSQQSQAKRSFRNFGDFLDAFDQQSKAIDETGDGD